MSNGRSGGDEGKTKDLSRRFYQVSHQGLNVRRERTIPKHTSALQPELSSKALLETLGLVSSASGWFNHRDGIVILSISTVCLMPLSASAEAAVPTSEADKLN